MKPADCTSGPHGIVGPIRRRLSVSGKNVLKRIAHVSGGECFLPEDYTQVIPICRRIAADIRNRYTIGYVPIRSGSSAGIRNIKVTASSAGHEHLMIRAHSSYLLPEKQPAR